MDLTKTLELEFEEIIRETDKAYQVKFDNRNIVWLPKSQTRIVSKSDNYILIPEWLVDDKQLEEFEIK